MSAPPQPELRARPGPYVAAMFGHPARAAMRGQPLPERRCADSHCEGSPVRPVWSAAARSYRTARVRHLGAGDGWGLSSGGASGSRVNDSDALIPPLKPWATSRSKANGRGVTRGVVHPCSGGGLGGRKPARSAPVESMLEARGAPVGKVVRNHVARSLATKSEAHGLPVCGP